MTKKSGKKIFINLNVKIIHNYIKLSTDYFYVTVHWKLWEDFFLLKKKKEKKKKFNLFL